VRPKTQLEDETMRNAALVLGLIGGIWAMLVGFFVYGYVEFVDWFGEVPDLARQVEDPALFRTVSILSPLLAIAGAAMARARALWGGILMLLAAGGIYHAFGFGVFTMFPIAFCGLAGVLALAAGNPTRKRRISRKLVPISARKSYRRHWLTEPTAMCAI
jgi:hypothetical protein